MGHSLFFSEFSWILFFPSNMNAGNRFMVRCYKRSAEKRIEQQSLKPLFISSVRSGVISN